MTASTQHADSSSHADDSPETRPRRSWFQRFVIVVAVVEIVAALVAAGLTHTIHSSVGAIGRVRVSGDVLFAEQSSGDPVNFLIIGVDSAAGLPEDDPARLNRMIDPAGRHLADTIALVRIDPATRQAWVLSIPRDLVVTRPGTQQEHKINHMTFFGGPELLAQTISENFDVQLHHYLQLDFLAFKEVVDHLDGVPVCFDYPTRDQDSDLRVDTAGCHTLDGAQALAFVRSRSTEEFVDGVWRWAIDRTAPDLTRIAHQQEFLVKAAERAIERGARNIVNLSALLGAAADSVVMDSKLTVSELHDLVKRFDDTDPESLIRYSLKVVPQENYIGRHGVNIGSVLIAAEEVNEEYLDVFRGEVAGTAVGIAG